MNKILYDSLTEVERLMRGTDAIRTIEEFRKIEESKRRVETVNSKYLIFEYSPVYHFLNANSKPLCGSMTGSAYQTKHVDEPPDFLRPCKNCERIMNSGQSPDAIRRKKNAEWFRSVL